MLADTFRNLPIRTKSKSVAKKYHVLDDELRPKSLNGARWRKPGRCFGLRWARRVGETNGIEGDDGDIEDHSITNDQATHLTPNHTPSQPIMLTLPSVFTSLSPSKQSSHPCITLPASEGRTERLHLSYKQTSTYIDAFASELQRIGVEGGQVVSASLINGIEFVGFFLATGAIRAVSAPLNPAYSTSEIEFYLDDTKSSVLLVAANTPSSHETFTAAKKVGVKVVKVHLVRGEPLSVKLEVVYEPPKEKQQAQGRRAGEPGCVANRNQGSGGQAQEQDVALVLHTSGTTGRPKGVPLTHLNLLTTMANIVKTYEFTPTDNGYLVMPLFHVHGLLAGLLAPLLAGATIVIPPKFSAGSFWKDFTAERCTWYTAVPTIHSILLNSPLPNPLPKIRFIRSCSSSLSPTVFHNLEKTFKAPVLEAYAMTEAAHQMCSSPLPKHGARHPGSVGKPQGVDLSIRDVSTGKAVSTKGDKGRGEVCVRGKNVTLGYLNNDKANKEGYWDPEEEQLRGKKEARWFRTGDEGYLTNDGYLVLTGRLKEVRCQREFGSIELCEI